MAEYIDREALLKLVKPDEPDDEKAAITIATAKKLIRSSVNQVPVVDAVEVVRCKGCKHCYEAYFSSTGYRCKVWGVYDTDCEVTPEHFCSYGERKDNEN